MVKDFLIVLNCAISYEQSVAVRADVTPAQVSANNNGRQSLISNPIISLNDSEPGSDIDQVSGIINNDVTGY